MVAGNRVFVATCAGEMLCLDRRDGSTLWSYDAGEDGGQNFHGSMLLSEGLLCVGTDGSTGFLYGFDAATGAVRWRFEGGRGFSTDVLRHGQNVLAVSIEDDVERLVALDMQTGELRWEFVEPLAESDDERRPLNRSPAIVDHVVYLGTLSGKVYALEASNGEILWELDLGEPIVTPVTVDEEFLYCASASGQLFRVVRFAGFLADTTFLEGRPSGPPTPIEDALVVFVDWMGERSRVVTLQREALLHESMRLRRSDG